MPTKAPRAELWTRWVTAALAAAAALLAFPAAALAVPPPPSELEVRDGEDVWHSGRAFWLSWRNPAGVAAVHYRVRDPLGGVAVGERRLGWAATQTNVEIPGPPGAHTVEVWLEDSGGAEGPPAEARLRFDDARPAATEPHPGGIWLGRIAFPFTLRLAHPAGEPLSGIRGYAVAVDPVPGREPCAGADRCSAAETDLGGGIANDALAIPELPEGTSYVSAVAVSGSGMRSATTGRAVLRVDKTDPVTLLSGAPAGWSNHPLTLTAAATDAGSGMRPGGGVMPFTAIRVDGETPIVAAGGEVSTSLIAEGPHTVAYYARDLAGNLNDGGNGNGVSNHPPSTTQVRIDRTAPGVAFAGAQDPLDPELIRARIADSLSGPDPTRGWIGIRRAGSGDPFQALPRAPSPPGELRARWDSDAYPPGEYEFEAGGYDRAGNATKTQRRADGGAMILTDPLKIPTALFAGFRAARLSAPCERRRCEAAGGAGRRRGSRIVRYGRTVLLSGRLTDGGGRPLPGTPVRIVERFDGGLPATRESTVRSGANGDFAARLPAGPSREILAVFDGSPTLARAASRPLRLAVRGSVRLRASSTEVRVGGAPLVFRGLVAAAPGTIPPGGVSVQLQFRVGGRAWSEFRTVRTDGRGRFRYAYRFSDDDSRGARFQFRAYVPTQPDWPYEPGSSRPVIVRGR